MEIFSISNNNEKLTIEQKIKPIHFQDIKVADQNVREKNIENLIIDFPQLLNYGNCDIRDTQTSDILIIDQQARTSSNKITDLIGVHTDGSLVIIEVKRDKKDDTRAEAMEFQAIRYAAAYRNQPFDGIVNMYAEFLCKQENGEKNESHGAVPA